MNVPALAFLSTVTVLFGNTPGIAAVFQTTGNTPSGAQVALHAYPVRDDSSSLKKTMSPIQNAKGESRSRPPQKNRSPMPSVSKDIHRARHPKN